MLNYDVHAEAQARFTAAIGAQSVSSKQTTVNNVLKGIDISELGIDGIQTHDFIRKGTCREVDPLTKPFVHYTPLAVGASAVFAYAISRVAPTHGGNVLLAAFGVVEGLNVRHNHIEGCE